MHISFPKKPSDPVIIYDSSINGDVSEVITLDNQNVSMPKFIQVKFEVDLGDMLVLEGRFSDDEPFVAIGKAQDESVISPVIPTKQMRVRRISGSGNSVVRALFMNPNPS